MKSKSLVLTTSIMMGIVFSLVASPLKNWYYTSYSDAQAQAEKTKKPLFIYLHKPNCSRCTSTWNGIVNNKKLVERLKKEVVLVYIDTKTNSSDFSTAYFKIRKNGGRFGTPLIGIINQKSQVLVDNEGYASVDKINQFLDKLKK